MTPLPPPCAKCRNSKTWGSTTPCSYIFVNLLYFLYQFRYHQYSDFKMKNFRDDPNKSLLCYIKSLATKYQIWHSWAMVILSFFFFLNKKILSDLALMSHNNFARFLLNNIFFFFFNFFNFIFIFVIFIFSMGHHRGDTTVMAPGETQVAFKNCAPFTKCITKIDGTT